MVSGYSSSIKWDTVISWKFSFITLSIINAHVPPFCFKSFLWEYFYNEIFPKLSSETYETAENDKHSFLYDADGIYKDILHFSEKYSDIVVWKPTWLNIFPMVKISEHFNNESNCTMKILRINENNGIFVSSSLPHFPISIKIIETIKTWSWWTFSKEEWLS